MDAFTLESLAVCALKHVLFYRPGKKPKWANEMHE